MRHIDIQITYEGFRFMLKHSENRTAFSKGNPLYCLYYRDKDGNLASTVLSVSNLSLLVSNHCKFRCYQDKIEFGYFLNSLRCIPIESDNINYRWRVYD